MNGLGQVDDLGGVRKGISSRSIFGSGTLRQGLAPGYPGCGGAAAASSGNTSRDGSHRPAGGPHSAELGRDGEHSWTKAVQQVILRHGDASSQLDLAISTLEGRRSAQVGDVPQCRNIPGTGQAIRFPAR
jgi:hypothetical protein